MKGDFSRFTFDPRKHYSGVRLQQGRMQLDADWNEQQDIELHRLETTAKDLLGLAAAPADSEEGGRFLSNFKIFVHPPDGRLMVKAGRFYVDGILCELEEDQDLEGQADLPGYLLPTHPGTYLAYLDVWQRLVTVAEEPGLKEPALGGPDTTARGRVMAQVKLAEVGASATCAGFGASWTPQGDPRPARGRLAARALTAPPTDRLYRVEIHRGGGVGEATFKWSRDNATVLAMVERLGPRDITISSPIGEDGARGFAAGQWVEVSDQARLLAGRRGELVRLAEVAGQFLRVEDWPGGVVPNLGEGTVLRRWDSQADTALENMESNGGFLPLEDGVEVRFEMDPEALLTSGDYWLIPARSSAGVLWPMTEGGEPEAQPPRGIDHHYAALALLECSTEGTWAVRSDCRRQFAPATQIPDPDTKLNRDRDDIMTGPLLIESDLFVTGQAHLGGQGIPDQGVQLKISGGALMATEGAGEAAGIRFPAVGQGESTSVASVHFLDEGDAGRQLRFGVTGGADPSIRLQAGGTNTLVVKGGNIGIRTADPQAKVDVQGNFRTGGPLHLAGPLTLLGGTETHVLTADGTGVGTWRPIPLRGTGKPIFLTSIAPVGSSAASDPEDAEVELTDLPSDAKAVILEAEGDLRGVGEVLILVGTGPAPAFRVLLRMELLEGSSETSWAAQGIFPVAERRLRYVLETSGSPPFDWAIRAVGYLR